MNIDLDEWMRANTDDGTIIIFKTIETALPCDFSWVYPYIEVEENYD